MMAYLVYVIESPSSQDLLDGRTEGRVLIEALTLSGTTAAYSLVTDRDTLCQALGTRLHESVAARRLPPVLHFSLHGNGEGIALTNGDFVTWQELRELLLPINHALNGALLVCLSACYGASGCRMAMYENQPLPFHALVSHPGTANWDDAAIAFATLYHRLSKGARIEDAVEAMKVASGDSGFMLQHGRSVLEGYTEYVHKQRRLSEIIDSLERLAAERMQTNPSGGGDPSVIS